MAQHNISTEKDLRRGGSAGGHARIAMYCLLGGDGLVDRSARKAVVQALAADPRQLDDLADRVDQLGAVSKVALIVEGLAILNTPVPVGMRDVVLVIVDRHKSARLGTQQLQKSFEVSLDDISSLEHDDYLLAQRHHGALINVGTPLVKPLSIDMRP